MNSSADFIETASAGGGRLRKRQPTLIDVERVAVVGLGYVGLPVAVAFARKFRHVVGFDISASRIKSLIDLHDRTGEVGADELRQSSLSLTSNPQDLAGSSFFVVTVPTPIDKQRRPDLRPLEFRLSVDRPILINGAVVVFESTVYPGVTEDFCGPLIETLRLEAWHRLQAWLFSEAYQSRRCCPSACQNIAKVVAGEDADTLERVASAYGSIIGAEVYRAPSIKVAEAAKVLENTQRDLNIALMNELAIILDRMGIRTRDVLDAAATKWNFLNFTPEIVGGHCIGIDPYYLTSAAKRTATIRKSFLPAAG